MKPQVRNEYDLVGKTISDAEKINGEDLFLSFTDGTFAYMEAEEDSGSRRLNVCGDFAPRWFSIDVLRSLDVLSAEELAEQEVADEERRRLYAAEAEARERKEFDRLKAKFEGVKP